MSAIRLQIDSLDAKIAQLQELFGHDEVYEGPIDLELAGTVYNDKEGQAAAIAKLAVEIISKKEITNKYTYLPYSKVTSDNVNDFLNKDK